MNLSDFVRTVPDFPSPGILFRDLTPLLGDASALAKSAQLLAAPYQGMGIRLVAGMEARGFIFATLVARELNAGFIPLRKAGKLPAAVEATCYALEYGTATLEVHADALKPNDTVLIVDDVLATGGTAAAAVDLIQRLGGDLKGLAFVVELEALQGRARLKGHSITRLMSF